MIKKILELSKELIAIESIASKPDELGRVIEACVGHLPGFTVERFENNGKPSVLFYASKKRPEKFDLILNAHLDVVPAERDQFKGIVNGNKLFGRGSADMKAAAAAELIVFSELAKKTNLNLGLQLVTDEEIGGFDCSLHQIKKDVKAKFVIAGEPSMLSVNQRSKGILRVTINATGVSSHSAYPWLGENAVWNLIEALHKLRQSPFFPDSESWISTINLAKIETTNTALNTVPNSATAQLDIRYIKSERTGLLSAIEKACAGLATFTIGLDDPAYDFTDQEFDTIKLLESCRDEKYKLKKTVLKHGASDIRHFAGAGMVGVTFGPLGYHTHAKDEWVDIESLEIYANVLVDFIQKLDRDTR